MRASDPSAARFSVARAWGPSSLCDFARVTYVSTMLDARSFSSLSSYAATFACSSRQVRNTATTTHATATGTSARVVGCHTHCANVAAAPPANQSHLRATAESHATTSRSRSRILDADAELFRHLMDQRSDVMVLGDTDDPATRCALHEHQLERR